MNREQRNVPRGWETSTIGQLAAKVVVGFVGPSKRHYVSDGIPFLMGKNIKNGELDLSDLECVTAEFHESQPKSSLRPSDVVVVRIGRSGEAAVVPQALGDANCAGLVIVKGIDAISPEFLSTYLNSPDGLRASQANARGVTRQTLNTAKVASATVPVPPADEQLRILHEIEALQERSRKAREALSGVGPLLEQFRQSLLAAAFRGDLTADWRAENPDVEPASELLARIRQERRERWEQAELAKMEAAGRKPSGEGWKEKLSLPANIDDELKLDALPSSWQWISFDEVTATALYGPRFGVDEYDPSGIPTVRTTDMDFYGNIQLTNAPRVLIEARQRDHFLLRQDDLLITRTGATIGKAALFDSAIGDAIASAYLIRYRLVSKTVLPRYIFYFLMSPLGQAQLVGGAKAVAQPNVNTKTIAAIGLPLPPLEEQFRVVAMLDKAFAGVDGTFSHCATSRDELDRVDQSILAKAFRGELVPQDPSDEPASVLLDRIREQREAAGKKAKTPTRRRRKQPEGQSS